jgi:hypothetical protein
MSLNVLRHVEQLRTSLKLELPGNPRFEDLRIRLAKSWSGAIGAYITAHED